MANIKNNNVNYLWTDKEGIKYIFNKNSLDTENNDFYNELFINNKKLLDGKEYKIKCNYIIHDNYIPSIIKDSHIASLLEYNDENYLLVNNKLFKNKIKDDLDKLKSSFINDSNLAFINKTAANNGTFKLSNKEKLDRLIKKINIDQNLSYFNGDGYLNIYFDYDSTLKCEYNNEIINNNIINDLKKNNLLEQFIENNTSIEKLHYDINKKSLYIILREKLNKDKYIILNEGKIIKRDFFSNYIIKKDGNSKEDYIVHSYIKYFIYDKNKNLYYKAINNVYKKNEKNIKGGYFYDKILLKNSNIFKNYKSFIDVDTDNESKLMHSLDYDSGNIRSILNSNGSCGVFLNRKNIDNFINMGEISDNNYFNKVIYDENDTYNIYEVTNNGKLHFNIYKNGELLHKIKNNNILDYSNNPFGSIITYDFQFNSREKSFYLMVRSEKFLENSIFKINKNGDIKEISIINYSNSLNIKKIR